MDKQFVQHESPRCRDERAPVNYSGVSVMRTLPLMVCLPVVLFLAGCSGSLDKERFLPVHCLDKPAPGPCKGRMRSYYYDYPSNTCRMFLYGGCKGNVPFESRSACENACVGRRG